MAADEVAALDIGSAAREHTRLFAARFSGSTARRALVLHAVGSVGATARQARLTDHVATGALAARARAAGTAERVAARRAARGTDFPIAAAASVASLTVTAGLSWSAASFARRAVAREPRGAPGSVVRAAALTVAAARQTGAPGGAQRRLHALRLGLGADETIAAARLTHSAARAARTVAARSPRAARGSNREAPAGDAAIPAPRQYDRDDGESVESQLSLRRSGGARRVPARHHRGRRQPHGRELEATRSARYSCRRTRARGARRERLRVSAFCGVFNL